MLKRQSNRNNELSQYVQAREISSVAEVSCGDTFSEKYQ